MNNEAEKEDANFAPPLSGGEKNSTRQVEENDAIPDLGSLFAPAEEKIVPEDADAPAELREEEEQGKEPPAAEVPAPAVPEDAPAAAAAAAEENAPPLSVGSIREEKTEHAPAMKKAAAAPPKDAHIQEPLRIPELPAKFHDPEAMKNVSFGACFRELRELCGYSLHQLSELTKIRETYLAALEEEDLSTLPPLIYIIAYLRQLAKFYRLSDEVSDAITAELRGSLEYEKPENAAKQVIGSEKNEENDRILKKLVVGISAVVVLVLLLIGTALFLLLRRPAEKTGAAKTPGRVDVRAIIGEAEVEPLQIRD